MFVFFHFREKQPNNPKPKQLCKAHTLNQLLTAAFSEGRIPAGVGVLVKNTAATKTPAAPRNPQRTERHREVRIHAGAPGACHGGSRGDPPSPTTPCHRGLKAGHRVATSKTSWLRPHPRHKVYTFMSARPR